MCGFILVIDCYRLVDSPAILISAYSLSQNTDFGEHLRKQVRRFDGVVLLFGETPRYVFIDNLGRTTIHVLLEIAVYDESYADYQEYYHDEFHGDTIDREKLCGPSKSSEYYIFAPRNR